MPCEERSAWLRKSSLNRLYDERVVRYSFESIEESILLATYIATQFPTLLKNYNLSVALMQACADYILICQHNFGHDWNKRHQAYRQDFQ